jgi:hypothetical protein
MHSALVQKKTVKKNYLDCGDFFLIARKKKYKVYLISVSVGAEDHEP